MHKYLSTLHEKPEHHKKRFAFLVSGGVTLSIFAIWAVANFGPNGTLVRSAEVREEKTEEVSPLDSLKRGFSSGLSGIGNTFSGLKASLSGSAKLESETESMKGGVFNVYGQ